MAWQMMPVRLQTKATSFQGGVDKLAAYMSCLSEANRLMVPVLFGLNRSPLEVKS